MVKRLKTPMLNLCSSIPPLNVSYVKPTTHWIVQNNTHRTDKSRNIFVNWYIYL